MERAVSPFASFVMMLEVTPPGQQASMMRPTASSPSRPAAVATAKPISGSTNIWFTIPIPNALGSLNIREKSSIVRPIPSENMMKASDTGSTTSTITLLSASPLSSS